MLNEERVKVDGSSEFKYQRQVEQDEVFDSVAPSLLAQFPYDPPFFLVASSGPAAQHQSFMFGLYRKTEEKIEGRSVYAQEYDKQYKEGTMRKDFRALFVDGGHNKVPKLFIDHGVWVIRDVYDKVVLRAAMPSHTPVSVKWQYQSMDEWHKDQEMTVTGLSEKPSDCEITITLTEDVVRKDFNGIMYPGVAGVYRADGTYCNGRPVLQHEEGEFTLYSAGSNWKVSNGVHNFWDTLWSGSAPTLCPADPRAARNEKQGVRNWRYRPDKGRWRAYQSDGISLKCNKHEYSKFWRALNV